MTSVKGFIEPLKRPDVLGVHSVDHFSIEVPDLKVAQNFYSTFGLDVREEGNNLGLYAEGDDHRWGVISEGKAKRLAYLSFGVYEDDMERFKRHLEGLGVKLSDPPKGISSNGLWVEDPAGVRIELRAADKVSPSEKSPFINRSSPPGVAGSPGRAFIKPVKPDRMSHVLTFTPDVPKAIDFYSNALGIRVSDRSGDDICFMHGVHGSDHHMIAFARSEAPGFHHCSWIMESVNEIGLGAKQMAEAGFDKGWGLGRHVLGANYFHYVRDPWGSYCEYAADIDYVPYDCDWEAGDHPGEDSIYVWGPLIPEDFVHNYESGQ